MVVTDTFEQKTLIETVMTERGYARLLDQVAAGTVLCQEDNILPRGCCLAQVRLMDNYH
jgi:hypothetical protein